MRSKVDICNQALSSIGAEGIRDFTEVNKRARMSSVFFDTTRDYLLSRFDWPFARKYANLNQISDPIGVPEGWYAFLPPPDCLIPRDIAPLGTSVVWRMQGDMILTKQSSDVWLHYTAQIINESLFSNAFSNLLALGVAARLAPAVSKDKAVIKMIYNEYRIEQNDIFAGEANIGNEWIDYDGDPDNDSFVHGSTKLL